MFRTELESNAHLIHRCVYLACARFVSLAQQNKTPQPPLLTDLHQHGHRSAPPPRPHCRRRHRHGVRSANGWSSRHKVHVCVARVRACSICARCVPQFRQNLRRHRPPASPLVHREPSCKWPWRARQWRLRSRRPSWQSRRSHQVGAERAAHTERGAGRGATRNRTRWMQLTAGRS